MPETPVDEDDGAIPLQHEIRSARQSSIVKAKPEAGPVEKATNREFRTGAPTANALHDSATQRVDADLDGRRGIGGLGSIRSHSAMPRWRSGPSRERTACFLRGEIRSAGGTDRRAARGRLTQRPARSRNVLGPARTDARRLRHDREPWADLARTRVDDHRARHVRGRVRRPMLTRLSRSRRPKGFR